MLFIMYLLQYLFIWRSDEPDDDLGDYFQEILGTRTLAGLVENIVDYGVHAYIMKVLSYDALDRSSHTIRAVVRSCCFCPFVYNRSPQDAPASFDGRLPLTGYA